MIPFQAFLLSAAALFSVGIYCLIVAQTKFTILMGTEFCSSSVCLALATMARYIPNQAPLILSFSFILYGMAQLIIVSAILWPEPKTERAEPTNSKQDFSTKK